VGDVVGADVLGAKVPKRAWQKLRRGPAPGKISGPGINVLTGEERRFVRGR